jgi:2-keto-4-pentenoate hydratase/2-oxohepta-3-ene-1,7-dioic acid hydratase in catechol pathway
MLTAGWKVFSETFVHTRMNDYDDLAFLRELLFVKGLNTLQHPGDPIFIPTHLASDEVDYECELAVVIGRECKNVARKNALNYVLGYTCANDVSARDWQLKKGGGQWNRGKTFDLF